MKRFLSFLVTILALLIVVSCASSEEKENQIDGVGNGLNPCKHSTIILDNIILDNSYHQISRQLISYIGEDAFNEWVNKNNEEDLNIIRFVIDNDIPYEYMEQLILTDPSVYYYFDYNLDAIYSGKEDYYTGDRTEKVLRRNFLLSVKCGLNDLIKNNEKYSKWIEEKKNSEWEYCNNCGDFDGNMRQWSISEVVAYFNITEKEMSEINDRATKTVMYSCELDFDSVFSDSNYTTDPAIIDDMCVRFDFEKLKETIELIESGYEIIP